MSTTDPEQDSDFEDATDTVETLPHSSRLTVIGIGASAGGLDALRRFFKALPANTGMTFVVVLHLSPEHESIVADLLQPNTSMPVQQVMGRIEMQPNSVYVIPPGRGLVVSDDSLDLTDLEMVRGRRLQIDAFFQSLAKHQGDGAAIILSGAGSDGAVGIQSIKEKGGLILVQSPDEAEYNSMPKSAMLTGLVDIVAPVDELAAQLVAAKRTQAALQLPTDASALSDIAQETLLRILAHLRTQTGHDFSGYKRATLLRRMSNRMQIAQVETLSAYLHRLRQDADEVEALHRDLLIHVTEFFRDPEAWQKLAQEIIPRIFTGKGRDDTVRVWTVGCASGEEVYSLAILLMEYVGRLPQPPEFQIFASDLGKVALEFAREGLYPEAIAANITEELLARYFTKENSHYRVRPEVRQHVLFTNHNLLQDPPFSRLDLITCRNLLIYLQREVQERVLESFHYALLPQGYLFLGSAESVDGSELFDTVDKRSRLYQRNQQNPDLLILPTSSLLPSTRRYVPSREALSASESGPLGTEHRALLEEKGPPSLLVDENYQVLHLSETAGRYLQPPGGAPTQDVLRLVRPELQADLRSALFRVFDGGSNGVMTQPTPVRFNGAPHPVSLWVRVSDTDQRRALICFLEDETPAPEHLLTDEESKNATLVSELEIELRHTQMRLQTTREEYETTVEELRAANEELQSTNEEYRSTLEELETSKEELQSVNEELQTVNQELQNKIEQVSQSHSDLQNLLVSTEIATLFLDRDLHIKRYTPRAVDLFNLLPADRGRPISHLRANLNYPTMQSDTRQVLSDLVTIQREVESTDGRWYMVNLRPYRSLDDRIEGVVMTFVDITANKENELALAKAKVYAESIVHTIPDALLVLETDLRVRTVNDTFYEMFAVSPEDTEGQLVYDLGNGQWNIPELRTLLEEILPENNVFIGYEVEHTFETIGKRAMLLSGRRLDHVQLILLAITDITARKQAEETLRQTQESLAIALEAAEMGTWDFDITTNQTRTNLRHNQILGCTEPLDGWNPTIFREQFVLPEDRSMFQTAYEQALETGDLDVEVRIRWPDGAVRWIHDQGRVYYDNEGKPQRIAGVTVDVTGQKEAHLAEMRRRILHAQELAVCRRESSFTEF
ncbi:MAG: PAS domain-containing protein, partial [Caldilineaceae bacterium]|nr:PAS domain-containing protein [Caldilineaceae bacterium]